MKNFILGILTAIGGFALCGKMYEKGYNDCTEDNKNNKNRKVPYIKKDKETK